MKGRVSAEHHDPDSSTLGSNDPHLSQVEMTAENKDEHGPPSLIQNETPTPPQDGPIRLVTPKELDYPSPIKETIEVITPTDDVEIEMAARLATAEILNVPSFDASKDTPPQISPGTTSNRPIATTLKEAPTGLQETLAVITPPTDALIEMAARPKAPVEILNVPSLNGTKETTEHQDTQTTNDRPFSTLLEETPLTLQETLHALEGPPLALEAINLSDKFATAKAKLFGLLDYIDEQNCIYSPLHKIKLRKSVTDVIFSLKIKFGTKLSFFGKTVYSANFMPDRTEQSKVQMLYKIFNAVADPVHHAEHLKLHVESNLPDYPAHSSLFYKFAAGLEFIVGIACWTASSLLGMATLIGFIGIPPSFALTMHSYATYEKGNLAAEKEKLKKINVFFDQYLSDDYDMAKQKLFATLGLSCPAIEKKEAPAEVIIVDGIEKLKDNYLFHQQIQELIQELDAGPLSSKEKTEILLKLNDTLVDPLNNADNFHRYVATVRKKHYSSPEIARFTTSLALVGGMLVGALSLAFLWVGWGALGLLPTVGLLKLAQHQNKKEHLGLATLSLMDINRDIQYGMPRQKL